jgi:hypothetical protein
LVFPAPFHALDARATKARDCTSGEMASLRAVQRSRVAYRFPSDRGPQNACGVFDLG